MLSTFDFIKFFSKITELPNSLQDKSFYISSILRRLNEKLDVERKMDYVCSRIKIIRCNLKLYKNLQNFEHLIYFHCSIKFINSSGYFWLSIETNALNFFKVEET